MSKIIKNSESILIDIGDNDTTATSTFTANGILKGISVDAPDLTDSHTYTVSLLDENDGTIVSFAGLSENSVTSKYVDGNSYYLQQPLYGTVTVKIVTSASETADVTFTVDVYYQLS